MSEGSAHDVEVKIDERRLAGTCVGSSIDGSATVIIEPGLGNSATQLNSVIAEVQRFTRVCSYDRAGLGGSDPVAGQRTFTDVVDDLDAFVRGADIEPPYVLVGQSIGASVVIRYAQLHPTEVSGFVSMNPVPPYTSWIQRASAVETSVELQTMEVEFYEGSNDESIDLRDTDLIMGSSLPDGLDYLVMFAEDCPGDFCDRIRPVLRDATAALAGLGSGGRSVAIDGAGHEIYRTHQELVVDEIIALIG